MNSRKLNNRGYMLIEIILASAIAFTIAWFIIDLTIRIKNKNDDVLVETTVATDQTIAMNKLMSMAMDDPENICDGSFSINNNVIRYNGSQIAIFDEYAKLGINIAYRYQ